MKLGGTAAMLALLVGAPELAGEVAPRPQTGGAEPLATRPEASEEVSGAVAEESVAVASEPPASAPSSTPAPAPAPATADGPPFYDEQQLAALRARYHIPADPHDRPRPPIWRCIIPDPRCGLTVELVATSAYTYRMRQGEVDEQRDLLRWHSGRAAYELWLDAPIFSEVRGRWKYTRLTLGPKAGVIASDGQNLWGNIGLGVRYWLGRGAWAATLEFSTALAFRLRGARGDNEPGPSRSPAGITADLGVGIGGWGAIVFGAQYDSPLAREEIPERFRQAAAGQIFVGFRGNVLWGAPAGAAVATHAATQRSVKAP